MESRQITLSLDKAKEWYYGDNDGLRALALQVFKKEELAGREFEKITTFKDACAALGIPAHVYECIGTLGDVLEEYAFKKGFIAACQLNIIRQALNKGHKMKFTKGTIYYPRIAFITKHSTFYKEELNDGSIVIIGSVKVDGNDIYHVLGGAAAYGGDAGLGCFCSYYSVGSAYTGAGFLGCATKEIAEHMSRYFAKEIFDAMYGDFVDYEWVKFNQIETNESN